MTTLLVNSVFKVVQVTNSEYRIIRNGDNRTREIRETLDQIMAIYELGYKVVD